MKRSKEEDRHERLEEVESKDNVGTCRTFDRTQTTGTGDGGTKAR